MKVLSRLIFPVILVFVLMGCFDTALGQSLLVSTNPPPSTGSSSINISFTAAAGGVGSPLGQTIYVTTSNGTNTTYTIVTSTVPNWIQPGGSSYPVANTPGPLIIGANAGTLNPGNYVANIVITAQGFTQATVNVTLVVTSTTAGLNVSANSLSFSYQAGSSPPPTQQVSVTSTTPNVAYTTSVSYMNSTGVNWVVVPSSGSTAQNPLTIGVNPSALQVSTVPYSATITIASAVGNATIDVSLVVTGSPTLNVSPAGPLQFYYQTGTSLPPAQSLSLTSSGGAIGFSIESVPNWLVLYPNNGAVASGATTTIAVNAQTANLTVGQYTAAIKIDTQGAENQQVVVQIVLTVSNNPGMVVTPTSLTFNAQFNGSAPSSQQLQVTSTNSQTALVYSASTAVTTPQGGSWLAATTAQNATTPGTATVSVNQTGLPPGTYNGSVILSSAGAGNNPVTIPVTLIVTNQTQLTATPTSLIFNYQTTQAPPALQVVQLGSTAAPLSYTFTSSSPQSATCPANWMHVDGNSGTTPAILIVSITTTGLTSGTCSGTITVTSAAAGNSPLVIPVTLNVSTSALLNVSPISISASAQAGSQNPPVQSVSLTSTDPNTQIQFSYQTSGGGWLFVSSSDVKTPSNLNVLISTTGLSPNVYNGTIVITSPGLPSPLTIPVTLTVTSSAALTVSSTSLTFSQPQGGPAPAAQTISTGLTGGSTSANYSVAYSSAFNWFTVQPTSGTLTSGSTTNLTVAVTNSTNLTQAGSPYTGQIIVTVPGIANSPLTIPVSLTITQPQTMSVSANSLSFSYQIGSSTNPAAQTLTISSTGGSAAFTIATSGGTWLSANPSSGNTGAGGSAQVSVSANPASLTPGTYTGTLTVTSPVLAQPLVVNVTFAVQPQPQPVALTVTNAASGQAGVISPGELITIKGTLLGPATGVSFGLNAQGGVDSTLSGVRVLFDSVAGTPTYVSAAQVNAIVPWEIAGRPVTHIQVEYLGVASTAIQVNISATAPGIFTLDSTGLGQAVMFNQTGTVNGPPGLNPNYVTQPAQRGSYPGFYATGCGTTNPPGTTGSVTPYPPLMPTVLPVTVTIGSGANQVTVSADSSAGGFAGAAPFVVTGVCQINFKIPANAPTGLNVPVTFAIGGATSPATVTMAIQ